MHYRHGLLAEQPAGLSTESEILRAALLCFVSKGYHGTSIREVAAGARLSVPGLYHHFGSKAKILDRLINDTMDDLIEITEAAVAGQERPGDRFDSAVAAHVYYHCERPEESFIGNSELRSLSRESRQLIVAKRDRQQRIFDNALQEGIDTGEFRSDWPHETSRAIVTMCTAVATWYSRTGPLAPDAIVAIYQDLARSMVRKGGLPVRRDTALAS